MEGDTVAGLALVDEAEEWCKDRLWEVRVPVLVYLSYVLVQHWRDLEYGSILSLFNFPIHELGHIVFRPFGEFLTIAGGSILQCLAPVVAAVLFYRQQRDFFAVAFSLAWLGTNLFGCATYCSDARGELNLVLYSPGGQAFGADGVGDWTRMLGQLGLLEHDLGIALFLKLAATASMLAGIALGGWLCWRMAAARARG